uniref:Wadjet anti-phage system protein JetA family protein n=1 Tax=Agathobacter sp. TaxID=2021311 RepID=UPI004055DEC5
MKNQFLEIPDCFWALFRSGNRQIYIDALLQINEEYRYSNYFLSKEICIATLSDYFSGNKVVLEDEEQEEELEVLEPTATRILHWLLKNQWLRKVEDYNEMVTYIVIPDYAAVFVDAFSHLAGEDEDETQVYIQNVYAILFSFRNDPRANIGLLKTALINTRKLNKSLQDMLHNIDKFFESLLKQEHYGDLLKEHLDGYVEEIVQKKYHILKTSDNFYLYKADIKKLLQEMRQNTQWLSGVCQKNKKLRGIELTPEDICEQLDLIEKGFADIEHRIINMDREHTRYIRATVTRLNYLLNTEDNMKGLVIQLLNSVAEAADKEKEEEKIQKVSRIINFSYPSIMSKKSFYKRRKGKMNFTDALAADEGTTEELSKEDILKLNKMKKRYSRQQIDAFVEAHMIEGRFSVTKDTINSNEDFEKLVLAYDWSIRKDSSFCVEKVGETQIDNGKYVYPEITFRHK